MGHGNSNGLVHLFISSLIQISKSATYMGIRLGIIVLGDGCAGQGLIVHSGSREMNMSLLFSLVKIVQSSEKSRHLFQILLRRASHSVGYLQRQLA